MNRGQLDRAPTANAYLQQLQNEESGREAVSVLARELHLGNSGTLVVIGRDLSLSQKATKDLANLARIPLAYFADMEPELRAMNFNRRLPQQIQQDQTLAIISNGNEVTEVRRQGLPRVAASEAIDVLLEQAPANISNDIRAIEYHRNGHLDLALVARSLTTEPVKGDEVCGGVHLTVEESGAVQVGPVSFRLICSNGAMARVCAGGQHRLRRGDGPDSGRKLMTSLREFARNAWMDWERVAAGLRDLATKAIKSDAVAGVVQRLRQRPFFVSAQAARRVESHLRDLGRDLTLYDLHNAITAVGSHDSDVLWRYRHRLRLGAGQLARGRVGVCGECRQLVIA